MSLQLILGSAGSGKSYQLYNEVISQSIKNPETNYLVIVPEQFTLQTQKDIVAMHPKHGVMNVDILSFLRFAYRIFDEIGGEGYPVLEDTGKSMVLRKVVEAKKNDLILFGTNVKKAGFINELKSLISELYQYNIQAEDFERMQEISGKKPVLKAKLSDLFTIYEGFRDYMKERYITAEEILSLLARVIDQSNWMKDTVICLDGFTGFTPCQYRLLSKMLQYAKKVMITVTIDPREKLEQEISEHQLFGLSKKMIRKLYQIAEETQTPIDYPVYPDKVSSCGVPFRFQGSPALAFLEANLFRYPYQIYTDKQEDILIHSTRDAEAEIAFVSREIKKLVREKGYRYRDIAIVSGDVKEYGRIVKRCFDLSQIPCFIDDKKDIMGNPFVELLRSVLVIVSEDFSYEGVMRFLRTGLTDCEAADIDLLENYIIATGVRGYRSYKEPFQRTYRSREAIPLDRINTVRSYLIEVLQPLYEMLKDKSKTIKDYTTAIYELGIGLRIEEKLDGFRADFQDNQMTSLSREFEQIYGIVMDLYDQMVLLLGEEHCSLKEFTQIIDTGLTEVKVGLIPPGVDEVVIGDTERTRLKDIRALFFVGANEGIIPKAIESGGILSDIERELLISNNIELAPTKRQQAFTEQFYIYLNLTKPREKLYITYHKVNGEGKAALPSFLISKLCQLIPSIRIKDEDLQEEDSEYILKDDGLSFLIEGIREYPGKEPTNQWRELCLYYKSRPEKQEILNRLVEGAFFINREKGISKQAAKLLYGNELKGSVTRLEKYAGCAFAHLMSYGLSLEQRQEYKLAVPDIGTIFHNAIDYFSKRLDTGEYTWHTIPDTVREQWAVESVARAVEEYESSVLKSSARNEYMITRIERITVRTLWALCNQIKQGSFEPLGYEQQFRHIPDSGLALGGRIDRLDIYEAEDKVYVRVIDYKSGNTLFDLGRVYYGLQQQLSVYLSAALDYLSKAYQGKEVIPAGIFYYHIDDPIVSKSEKAEEEIYKSLRMNGLVNHDKEILAFMDHKLMGPDGALAASVKSDIIPVETNKEGELNKRSSVASKQQLNQMIQYVNQKLVEDSRRILEGDTALNPYRLGEQTACDYCEYKSSCGFDPALPGYGFRNLAKKPVSEIKAEIWGES